MVEKHCCEEMHFFLKEGKVDIFFNKKLRGYAIGLKQSTSIQIIRFCPWCGIKLPEYLGDIWFDILEKDYGLASPYVEDADKLPPEFQTDEWWRKRGL